MRVFLEEVDLLQSMPLASRQLWQMRVVLRALQLNSKIEKARKAINVDVKDWNVNLDDALATKYDKIAWMSRRLAGRLYKQVRQPRCISRFTSRLGLTTSAKSNCPQFAELEKPHSSTQRLFAGPFSSNVCRRRRMSSTGKGC